MAQEYLLEIRKDKKSYEFGIYHPNKTRIKSYSGGVFHEGLLNAGYLMIKNSLNQLHEEKGVTKVKMVSNRFQYKNSEERPNKKTLENFKKELSGKLKNIELIL